MQRKRSSDDAFLDSEKPQKKQKPSDLNVSIPSSSSKALSFPSSAHNGNLNTLPELPEIRDISLADVPFIHAGVLDVKASLDFNASYDRLEFLGDAYLGLIASRIIFSRYPHYSAGKMSRQRELLIMNETLAEFSLAYGFEKRARLPKQYQMAGNREPSKSWTKVMGDIFEAYVAAIIISDSENGFSIAERWLTELWAPMLSDEDDAEVNLIAKVQLATKIAGKGVRIAYLDEAQPGVFKKDGRLLYQVGAYVTGWGWQNTHLGSGKGWNKIEAGNRAATEAMSNPLTARIGAIKHDFDLKTAEEKKRQGSSAGMSKT